MLFNMHICSVCHCKYTSPFNLVRHMRLRYVNKEAPVFERAFVAPGAPRALGET